LPIRSAIKTSGGAVALICSGKRTAQQTKGQVALKKSPAPIFLRELMQALLLWVNQFCCLSILDLFQ
jgi:hypothetical protein